MESPSLPQKESQEEPGPDERGDQPPPETGADDVPPEEATRDDDPGPGQGEAGAP